MKSIRNHLSLVIALVSILFSIQIFIIVDRSIDAYKENLASNYSVVVVSKMILDANATLNSNKIISEISNLTPDSVIERLNTGMSAKNVELLKLTLPKFYKIKLKYYPTPDEINLLTEKLLQNNSIIKVENFSHNHDTTYKLLLLFKNVISVFSISMLVVTVLLILKELKIWQFKHNERMTVMGLFGAPVWMRSAVLFRLAIVDALIASAFAFILFSIISTDAWVLEQFKYIGIEVVAFDPVYDFLTLTLIAIFLSIVLATLIVLGHKEEV
jgi:cell division transport system permease protein